MQIGITYVSDEWADDRAAFNEQPGFSGSGGNKNLKAFESVQADISLEYYYAPGSALGVTLFHKQVDNFIVPLVIDSQREFAGQAGLVDAGTISISPYSTVGNGTDAVSKGVEVFIQHAFDSGFGIYANYTYNNTSIYYEGDSFNIRASYNKRGET